VRGGVPLRRAPVAAGMGIVGAAPRTAPGQVARVVERRRVGAASTFADAGEEVL